MFDNGRLKQATYDTSQGFGLRSEEHTSEPQSHVNLVCRLLLEKKKNRFILVLGSGKRLNEHVIGDGWPGIVERQERFSEAYDIIRGLLEGSVKNYRGQVLHARRREVVRPARSRPRDNRRS